MRINKETVLSGSGFRNCRGLVHHAYTTALSSYGIILTHCRIQIATMLKVASFGVAACYHIQLPKGADARRQAILKHLMDEVFC